MFVVVEGIDGSGKSTQVNLLAGALKLIKIDKDGKIDKIGKDGKDPYVLVTCEPTNREKSTEEWKKDFKNFIGEHKLNTATNWSRNFARYKFFMHDRQRHVEGVIIPHLKNGHVIICDRYWPSTVAYQGGEDKIKIEDIVKENTCFPSPDYIFILTISPKKAFDRIEARDSLYLEQDDLQVLIDADKNYLSIKEYAPTHNIIYIDADRTIQEVHKSIMTSIAH